MARRKADLDALADVVQEVRTLQTPDLDWERIENRIDALPPPQAADGSNKPSAWFWAGIGTLTASAATAGVLFLLSSGNVSLLRFSPLEQKEHASVRTMDGDALAVGARVTAGATEVSVEHAARARWVLSPNSAAVLSAKGEVISLRLESGAVVSHVVRSEKPETFAVRVGNARIAVHGTVFRVERLGERVLVDVSEGTVAVSDVSTPDARPGFVLRAPSHGDFSLDGRSGNIEGNAEKLEALKPRPTARQAANVRPTAAPAPSAVCEKPNAPAPSGEALKPVPSIVEIESGVTSTIDVVNGCFREHTGAPSDVRISVRTSVTLEVQPDGAIRSASFAPPLAPAVEFCAREKLAGLMFAPSREGITVKRLLDLKR